MRIAILTDYYYPQLGGITEHVHGQATNLSARGHEVTVITGNLFHPPAVTDGASAPAARDEPFEVLRMGQALRLYGNASQTLHTVDFRMISKMKKLFRERRFDVIHTHAPYNPGFVMIAPFAAPSSAITVGTFHSVFSPGPLLDVFGRAMRTSIGRLDGKIVVSEACIGSLVP